MTEDEYKEWLDEVEKVICREKWFIGTTTVTLTSTTTIMRTLFPKPIFITAYLRCLGALDIIKSHLVKESVIEGKLPIQIDEEI